MLKEPGGEELCVEWQRRAGATGLVLFVGFRPNRFVHDPLGTRSLGAVFGFVFFGLLCFSIGVLLTMCHVIALHTKGILPPNRARRT